MEKQVRKTGVVGFIVNKNQLLIGKRQPTVNYLPNAWNLPGGFVEEGEKIFQALVREIKEEANIDVIPQKIIGERLDVKRNINILYIEAMVEDLTQLQAGSDLQAVQFVKPEELQNYCNKEVIENWPFDYEAYLSYEKEDLSEYLMPTEYCDFNHNNIQIVAKYLKAQNNNTQNELVRRVFYFVRDTINYRVGDWSYKASYTLTIREGSCSNSANLLVALFRACGIPAAFGVMKVNGQKYLGPITPPNLAISLSQKSTHIYALVYLDGKWIKCDPADDTLFSLYTQQINPQSKIIEFDGYNDANLNLDSDHIFKDEFPLTNIDNILKKKMRKSLKYTVILGNYYIDFLRQHGYYFNTAKEAQKGFSRWLRKNKPYLFVVYEIYSLKVKLSSFNKSKS